MIPHTFLGGGATQTLTFPSDARIVIVTTHRVGDGELFDDGWRRDGQDLVWYGLHRNPCGCIVADYTPEELELCLRIVTMLTECELNRRATQRARTHGTEEGK